MGQLWDQGSDLPGTAPRAQDKGHRPAEGPLPVLQPQGPGFFPASPGQPAAPQPLPWPPRSLPAGFRSSLNPTPLSTLGCPMGRGSARLTTAAGEDGGRLQKGTPSTLPTPSGQEEERVCRGSLGRRTLASHDPIQGAPRPPASSQGHGRPLGPRPPAHKPGVSRSSMSTLPGAPGLGRTPWDRRRGTRTPGGREGRGVSPGQRPLCPAAPKGGSGGPWARGAGCPARCSLTWAAQSSAATASRASAAMSAGPTAAGARCFPGRRAAPARRRRRTGG